uniref:Claudin n=1 Tax=Callorhinchus milii TaxID=7868 RepID=K4FUQ1_CALMI|nr:claudin-10A-like protein [Callorhinchus milii]
MGATAFQITSLLLGFIGLVFVIVSTLSTAWKMSTFHATLITSTRTYDGLWRTCAFTSLGTMQCTFYWSLLALNPYVQACRALMIISIILGVLGTLMALFGLKCTNIGATDETKKGKIALSGGLVYLFAGVCCLVPISWYAFNVTQDFYNPIYAGTRYELGSALYIGWAGASLLILGGSFLCCSCKRNPKGYKYSAPKSGQRIYTKSETSQSKAYV